MHLMDTWTRLGHSMKIKWWTLSDVSSSQATWQNQGASSSIEQKRLNDDDSRMDVHSQPLIKDEETLITCNLYMNLHDC